MQEGPLAAVIQWGAVKEDASEAECGTPSALLCPKIVDSEAVETANNMEFRLVSVFQHRARPDDVEKLRSEIVHDMHYIRNAFPDFDQITVVDIDPNFYKALKDKYTPLLHYGSFHLPERRHLANELIWKWTEATGKYVGCQFWSENAKALFDSEVQSTNGWPITERLAKTIEKRLSAKSTDGKSRPSNARLTHEHVYPIKDMKTLLRSKDQPSLNDIRDLFDRQCQSCVVLESEHDRLRGDDANPWVRYASAGIVLADNPSWPHSQRQAIVEAYGKYRAGTLGR